MDIESSVVRKINRRIIPWLIIGGFLAYLDRVNLSFAAISMNEHLGFSPTVYGWGAGIFFIGFFIFEVPSNLALERFGGRLWLARIMFTWGLVSCAMAFVWSKESFYVLRFLLGAAEAGFFPGLVLYMTWWVPAAHRARLSSYFMVTIPLAGLIGAPISGWLLSIGSVAGLHNWQLLFILEGLPSVILALVFLKVLRDKPADAEWLEPEEKRWLESSLKAERGLNEQPRMGTLAALTNPDLLLFSLAFFGLVACNYGVAFWLPQIVRELGFSSLATGLLVAIPFAVGAVAMVWNARRSDAKRERRWHSAIPPLIAAAGLAGSTLFTDPVGKMLLLSLAAFGIFAVLAPFWALVSEQFPASAAAASIAFINAVGNLAGFAGPFAMGYFKETSGSFTAGLILVSLLGVVSFVIILAVGRPKASSSAAATARVKLG